jgi:hypothetical protein
MSCRVIHEGQLTEPFEVKTLLRQGCLISPFFFLLAVDWIMGTKNIRGKKWDQWSLTAS